jgi:hypothetical protein
VARCQDLKATGVVVGEERPHAPGCRLQMNLVNKDRVSVVVCDRAVRLGRFNRRFAAWRLAGASSPRRANLLLKDPKVRYIVLTPHVIE